MKRFVFAVLVVTGLGARGSVVTAAIEMDVSGIGTDLPVDSASFSMFGYPHGHSTDGGGRTTHPTLSDLVISRPVDSASPLLLDAAVMGTLIPTAEFRFCESSCSAPTTYLTVTLEDVLLSSYTLSPVGVEGPEESITFVYSKFGIKYSPKPQPPKTAWGVIMPATLPVGGTEPYQFDFVLDDAAMEAFFNRPLSPLGDSLPATLYHTSAVPEPTAVWLVMFAVLAALVGSRCGRTCPMSKARSQRLYSENLPLLVRFSGHDQPHTSVRENGRVFDTIYKCQKPLHR